MKNYRNFEEYLLEKGYVASADMAFAVQQQKEMVKNGERHPNIGTLLVARGKMTEKDYIRAMTEWAKCRYVDINRIEIPPAVSSLLPKNVAAQYGCIVFKVDENEKNVSLALKNPTDYEAIEMVRRYTRKKVIPYVSEADAIDLAIIRSYAAQSIDYAADEMLSELNEDSGAVSYSAHDVSEDSDEDAPTIQFVNEIIHRAITQKVSDIHIEPRKKKIYIRFRIDGVLQVIKTLEPELLSSVVARIKVMGGMNVAEHRIPLDGRTSVRLGKTEVDLRISSMPTVYGETIVIRLLFKTGELLHKDALGMGNDNMKKLEQLLKNPHGAILICGPTGSGKSTTSTSMLKTLLEERPGSNIISLEDPVEYNIDGINQTQVNEKTGMSFANGLRAAMRQDPDIISVGEIRDGETARIAMEAAITGHLVISTVHTNDAVSAFHRLFDLGVEPYLVGAGLIGIISQRLVRKICPNCKEVYEPLEEDFVRAGLSYQGRKTKLYRGTGCSSCYGTGYKGRTGVFEILILTPEMIEAISNRASYLELTDLAKKTNFITLKESCRELVFSGITTLEEMSKVIRTI